MIMLSRASALLFALTTFVAILENPFLCLLVVLLLTAVLIKPDIVQICLPKIANALDMAVHKVQNDCSNLSSANVTESQPRRPLSRDFFNGRLLLTLQVPIMTDHFEMLAKEDDNE
ncbi:hypothetical protein T07_2325 [Trichinella nelsoni]|uniref:Uncharacterized protein n=1 Tax=Trichinella nelsoni TaxID=6336 RepID=A0A0V0S5M0_9BILA|nr:hypothetical protein T07_2325 [Trichinella nelsoni]